MASHNRLKTILKPARAASLTGYGLVVGLIAVTAIAAVSNLGGEVEDLFVNVDTELSNAGASGSSGASSSGGSSSGASSSSGGSSGGPSGPEGCPNIGDTCNDGTVYAGDALDNSDRIFIMPTDQSSGINWKTTDSESFPDAEHCDDASTSCFTGAANTAFLVSTSNFTAGTHPAAELCDALSAATHEDWFLPALAEMDVIYSNMVANEHVTPANDPDNPVSLQGDFQDIGIAAPSSLSGPLAGSFTATTYWTSSGTVSDGAWRVLMNNGRQLFSAPNFARPVRCARRAP